jgi:hypothetical protein
MTQQTGDTLAPDSAEQRKTQQQFMEAFAAQVTAAIKVVGVDVVKAVERSVGDALARREFDQTGAPLPDKPSNAPDTPSDTPTKPTKKPDALKQALPTIMATVAASLLGAAAERGSVLRYAGAVPGAIELVARIRDKQDTKELTVPFLSSALGAAGPMLIK